MKTVLLSVGIVVLFLGLMLFGTIIDFKNKNVVFNNTITAQVDDMKAKYNEYFLKVKECAKVPTEQMEKIKEIYDAIITGRKNGGEMFRFITENNIPINQDTYVEIQRIIASGRAEIYNIQKVHIDTVREYNSYIEVFPNNIINSMFFNFKRKEPTLPIAEKVSNIFETKVDQEVEIFK